MKGIKHIQFRWFLVCAVAAVFVAALYVFRGQLTASEFLPAIFGLLGVMAGSLISIIQIKEETKRQKNQRIFEAKRGAYGRACTQFAKHQDIKFATDPAIIKYWNSLDAEQWYKHNLEFDVAMSELFIYAGERLEKLVQEAINRLSTVRNSNKQELVKQNEEFQNLRMRIIDAIRDDLEVDDYLVRF